MFPSFIFILMGLAIFVVFYSNYCNEKDAFNKGHCPKCGNKWRRIDMEGLNGRGYTCAKCDKSAFVTYFFVDKDFYNK